MINDHTYIYPSSHTTQSNTIQSIEACLGYWLSLPSKSAVTSNTTWTVFYYLKISPVRLALYLFARSLHHLKTTRYLRSIILFAVPVIWTFLVPSFIRLLVSYLFFLRLLWWFITRLKRGFSLAGCGFFNILFSGRYLPFIAAARLFNVQMNHFPPPPSFRGFIAVVFHVLAFLVGHSLEF